MASQRQYQSQSIGKGEMYFDSMQFIRGYWLVAVVAASSQAWGQGQTVRPADVRVSMYRRLSKFYCVISSSPASMPCCRFIKRRTNAS